MDDSENSSYFKVLSIQSHVVSGYVGNKSACFPLQVLGFEVDSINSVQLSNHTGYKHIKGQCLNADDLQELYDGLKLNNLVNYTHVLTGYVGTVTFLQKLIDTIKDLKKSDPSLYYVCDPVMGDDNQMYVPEELLPIYKDSVIPLADLITPNQYETEKKNKQGASSPKTYYFRKQRALLPNVYKLPSDFVNISEKAVYSVRTIDLDIAPAVLLTGKAIKSKEDVMEAIDIFHSKGVETVVISSAELGSSDKLQLFGSSIKGGTKSVIHMEIPKINCPAKISFTGTGDLFTALLLAWMAKTGGNLKVSCEKVVNTMISVINRTVKYALTTEDPELPQSIELKLIQSKKDIENPPEVLKCHEL